jgi:CBS domain containing-hemolysin-like protein
MTDLQGFLQLPFAGLCLLGGVLASAAQISVRALGQDRQEELLKSGLASRPLRAWLEAPLRMMLSTMVTRVTLPAVAAWLLADWVGNMARRPDLALQAALVAPAFQVLVGEVLVATWAKHRAAWVANMALAAYQPLDVVLWPLSALLALTARKLAHRLAPEDAQAAMSGPFLMEEDLARLWGLSPTAGQAPRQEHHLLRGVLEFQDAVVRDVMVPRTRMLAVDVDTPMEELIKTYARNGHTRMPVFQGGLDQVVGVLFLTDVLRTVSGAGNATVRALMRRPYFVPEMMKVSDLLREFQKRRTHLAVVVDEFGTTSGMATLQDVIEEIVGDVRDEEDVQDPSIKQQGETSWLMDGRTSIDSASAALGLALPSEGAYETLGGFLITRLGRLPGPGTTHRWEGVLFTVKESDEKRVVKVLLERVQADAPATDG